MIDSVLDVLEVFVSLWHANFSELVNHLFLWVLSAVLDSLVDSIELLSEGLFRLFAVNLGKLLHLHLVFCHKMFLLLSQVSQVSSGCSSKDLARWDCGASLDN